MHSVPDESSSGFSLELASTLRNPRYLDTLALGVFTLPQKRTHVILPDDLLAEIDTLVGERGRSAFLVEVLREEVRRRRLLRFLSQSEPAWKDEDHPELAEGSEAWVRKMRDDDVRLEREKLGDWVGGGRNDE